MKIGAPVTSGVRPPLSASQKHIFPAPGLTRRERDVLLLLCDGLPNKLISRELNISLSTVKIHIGNIMRKLNVSSRLQVVIAATRVQVLVATAGEADRAKAHAITSLATISAFELDETAQRFAA